jgi:hypothetical protein
MIIRRPRAAALDNSQNKTQNIEQHPKHSTTAKTKHKTLNTSQNKRADIDTSDHFQTFEQCDHFQTFEQRRNKSTKRRKHLNKRLENVKTKAQTLSAPHSNPQELYKHRVSKVWLRFL